MNHGEKSTGLARNPLWHLYITRLINVEGILAAVPSWGVSVGIAHVLQWILSWHNSYIRSVMSVECISAVVPHWVVSVGRTQDQLWILPDTIQPSPGGTWGANPGLKRTFHKPHNTAWEPESINIPAPHFHWKTEKQDCLCATIHNTQYKIKLEI